MSSRAVVSSAQRRTTRPTQPLGPKEEEEEDEIQQVWTNDKTFLGRLELRLRPGLEEAERLDLEKRTLAGENNAALKAKLLDKWAAGPLGVRDLLKDNIAKPVIAKLKKGARAVLEAVEPLELLERRLKQAESEAFDRTRAAQVRLIAVFI